MRFLIDANLPRAVIAALERAGHQVEFARDVGLGSAPDEQIAARARESGAALLTRDIDFADVRRYPPNQYCGIVVVRMPDTAVALEIVRVPVRFPVGTWIPRAPLWAAGDRRSGPRAVPSAVAPNARAVSIKNIKIERDDPQKTVSSASGAMLYHAAGSVTSSTSGSSRPSAALVRRIVQTTLGLVVSLGRLKCPPGSPT